jgi:hypothetical protein
LTTAVHQHVTPADSPGGLAQFNRLLPSATDAIILAVASAAAYGTGWLYRVGQLAGMGVPADFAEPTINFGTLWAATFFTVVVVMTFATTRTATLPKFDRAGVITVVGVSTVVAIAIAIVFWQYGIAAIQVAGLAVIVGLAIAFQGQRARTTIVIMAAIAQTLLSSYFAGWENVSDATKRTIVRQAGKDWLLATVFDSQLVGVPFDGKSLTAGPGFTIMEITERMTMSAELIGKVTFVQGVYRTPAASQPATTNPASAPAKP